MHDAALSHGTDNLSPWVHLRFVDNSELINYFTLGLSHGFPPGADVITWSALCDVDAATAIP